MNLTKYLGIIALSSCLFAGCASIAYSEKDETINFDQYQTYAWINTQASQHDSSATRVSDLTERNIKDAVNKELTTAGWKQSKKPDVLLAYDVLVEKTSKELNDPVYAQPYTRYLYNPYARRWVTVYYPAQFLGYSQDLQHVREGTITLSLIDAHTNKTIWQGWTTNEVNSTNLTSKEIRKAVQSIFRKFDIEKK